ncbi:MAG: methyltransferase domain-containing protein [Candidatus Euphemobacter frigidus]|nr:methyltransferase domain-containing protein [Candidatus Euphemobacter frigidus]MDP8275396.1 methyltransferase domain-containing protein [Candidatus Euphemobacter frigidus]
MSFDLLQRYRLSSELINAVRGKKPLRILDAGSRIGYLKSFLPEDVIVNLDIGFFSGYSQLVGDVLSLPFSSEAFEFSLSLDVLEHVEPSSRRDLLNEMARVSRDFFIVGAPFKEEQVEEAEKLANDFFLKVSGAENEFLSEHIHFGLPELDKVINWVEDSKFQAVVLPNNYLPRWLIMICLNAYLSHLPRAGDLVNLINSLYDRQFAEFDNCLPAYRHLVLVSKSGSLPAEKIRRRFTSPPLPRDFHRRAWDFAHRLLDELSAHHERVLLTLREEKNKLEKELYEEQERYIRTRMELEGIKGTFAYKLYQKTIGRIFNRSVNP